MRKRPVCSTQSSMNGSRSACSASDSERYAPSTMRQYSRTSLDYLSRFVFWTKSRRQVVRTGKLYHWRAEIEIGPIRHIGPIPDFRNLFASLPHAGVLPIQRLAQTREV